jgi:hypothetical protein
MKPAEAVSSSGLGTIRPDRQILNQPQQFLQLPKEKKINSAALHSQQLPRHTDTMLRRRLGNSFGSGSDVCTDSFGSGSDVCVRRRGARHQGRIDLRAGRRETPTTRVTATSM